MGLATVFAIVLIVASGLLIACSGFYWYSLGALTGCTGPGCLTPAYPYYTQFVAIDAVHGGMFVVTGVLGMLAGFKLGFPAGTIISLVFYFVVAIGLTVEIGLVFQLYGCSTPYSGPQSMLCDLVVLPGAYFGYMTYTIPLGIAWIGCISDLFALICWQKEDGSFSFDN